jgi:hypothetical protein
MRAGIFGFTASDFGGSAAKAAFHLWNYAAWLKPRPDTVRSSMELTNLGRL